MTAETMPGEVNSENARPGEDVIAALLRMRGPLWWEVELEKHWGSGQSSPDTRRAARVACNLAAQVRATHARAMLALEAEKALAEIRDGYVADQSAEQQFVWAQRRAAAALASIATARGEQP